MKAFKNAVALTGLALAVGIFLTPMNADAGRFRGASSGSGAYMVDTDGDGVVDSRPTAGTGAGANATAFVDADGDGICDTYAAGGVRLLDGTGAGSRGTNSRGNRR